MVITLISLMRYKGIDLSPVTWAFMWQSWGSDPLQSGSGVHLTTASLMLMWQEVWRQEVQVGFEGSPMSSRTEAFVPFAHDHPSAY